MNRAAVISIIFLLFVYVHLIPSALERDEDLIELPTTEDIFDAVVLDPDLESEDESPVYGGGKRENDEEQ